MYKPSPKGGHFSRNRRPQHSQSRGHSHSRGGGRSQRIDVSKFINKSVVVEEQAVFVPTHAFNDFAIDEKVKANIARKGYKEPSLIQDKAIPHVLDGDDVVGIANTGTGKTGAFLIPLVDKVLKNLKEQVLIVVPTRELAIQIDEELRGFGKGLGMYSAVCIGGAPIGKQISALRYHNNFIIGTPGRIKDLINKKCLDLSHFNTIVLDEADRMLDMGFIADMRFMMARMPKPRHTLFFSATLSKEIEGLISEFLDKPVRISVRTQETAANVDQDVVRIARGADKVEVLHNLLQNEEFKKVLVFGRTKHGVEKLSVLLAKRGVKADSIHGNKRHNKRQESLKLFKDNRLQVLVATDVAARGLDISDVSHVINFDIPATYEDYVHRIGRTGRGNKNGKALTFID